MRNAEKDAVEKAERRVRLLEAAFRLMSARSIEVEKAYAARGSVERAPWMLTVYAGYEF